MSKTDDGHYELVLGNRQLVSGFFVLIILFAIFLTLGYVLGLNSVVVTDPQESASRATPQEPGPRAPIRSAMAENPKPSASGAALVETTSEQAAAPQPVAATPATTTPGPVSTAPAVTSNTAAAQPPAQPTPTPAKPAATSPAPSASTKPTPVTEAQKILDSRVRVITPRKGDTFVQVAAIGRAEAELMAGQLQRRGYRTFITEVPGKDLFRVLVGPFETPAKLTETKAKLAAEGIESIVQRY